MKRSVVLRYALLSLVLGLVVLGAMGTPGAQAPPTPIVLQHLGTCDGDYCKYLRVVTFDNGTGTPTVCVVTVAELRGGISCTFGELTF